MRTGRRIATIALVAATVAGSAGYVSAHTRSQSRSSWWIDAERISAVFTAPVLEITRLGEAAIDDMAGEFARHLAASVGVRSGAQPCAPTAVPRPLPAEAGFVRAELSFSCRDTSALTLEISPFVDVAPSHLHMADVRFGGEPIRDYLFSDSVRQRELHRLGAKDPASAATSLAEYVTVGAEHILAGWDHLAFVVVLLLLCARPREVALAVTGFTLGHSVTLAAAVLGWLQPNPAAVEALIGYTIAVAALETSVVGGATAMRAAALSAVAGLVAVAASIAAQQFSVVPAIGGLMLFSVCYLAARGRRRACSSSHLVLTAAFGLIHGLGFASALIDMQLPTDRLLVALLGFNLGVEVGQLAIVIALSLFAAVLARTVRPRALSLAHTVASSGLLALGVFWLVSRSAG